jgi:hypothetical protein
MNEQQFASTAGQPAARVSLSERIDAIGWGLLFLMTGGFLLIPGNATILFNIWLVGVGFILLGANLARYLNGLKLRGFNTVLGVAAVAAGLGFFMGIDLSFLAIILILWGALILFREFTGKRESGERAE